MAVYAIARDEERHVARWAASARDADTLSIADTGSTDATVRRARELGATVHELRIQPFRYDEARNHALALVPEDIDVCVSLDLDEVLTPGWRERLEQVWSNGATRARCWYEWPWSEVDPALRFTTVDRIHARHGYRWDGPVHEHLVALGPEVVVGSEVEIHHLRDSLGTRPHYLALLRLAAAERPDDPRIAHLLGCEARVHGLWDEAVRHLRRALALPLRPHERLHTMLSLAQLEPASRGSWVMKACAGYPGRREPWCALAQLHLERGDWLACRGAARTALRIIQPADDYLANVFAWGPWPEQLAARASIELGDYDAAVHHARRAVRAAPGRDDLVELLRQSIGGLPQGYARGTPNSLPE